MSGLLWRYYLEDDVENFRLLLETASYNNARPGTHRGTVGAVTGATANTLGSPGRLGTSPNLSFKTSTLATSGVGSSIALFSSVVLTRADLNGRDGHGLTLLHHAASTETRNGLKFATALLEQSMTDLYVQDLENGWTALHRAFYFGNITIAQKILRRDIKDAISVASSGSNGHAGTLIKVKDKDGCAPFDLYAGTIKDRGPLEKDRLLSKSVAGDELEDEVVSIESDSSVGAAGSRIATSAINVEGDELFTFGSNKNITLGFGDEDDRQHPERIYLQRPGHLLRKLHREYLKMRSKGLTRDRAQGGRQRLLKHQQAGPLSSLPSVIRFKPIVIQDVQMSKLHTAVLTTDPESNLYMCGHGPGGRLGTGDQRTHFQFTCIEGGALPHKKVVSIALGQNHSLALSDEGEIFSWGGNAFGQLGYALPQQNLHDEEPVQLLPRQLFGPLKKEVVVGIAASKVHSIAHTTTALYTFGKNEGQLGIVDSDARSLQTQTIPRRVAASLFSSGIASVSAIDRATICLLENRDVWVFANYGYARLTFPLDSFSNYFLSHSFLTTRYLRTPNEIIKVTAGGNTICAMSSAGEVYTVAVGQHSEPIQSSSASTTNPSKIRGALSQPTCIWSLRKSHMAARDVAVDADGSIILTTEAGTVWKRTKRAKIKDASAAGSGSYKPKDYKFSRIPGLTGIVAVRASAYGAYAAVRVDCAATKEHIVVPPPTLQRDICPLVPFNSTSLLGKVQSPGDHKQRQLLDAISQVILYSKKLEEDLFNAFSFTSDSTALNYDMVVSTSGSEVQIPVHQFILGGRTRLLREGMALLRKEGSYSIPGVLTIQGNGDQRMSLRFEGLDLLTVVNFILYSYIDFIVDFWHYTRQFPKLAVRYRQIRTELMKLAARLELPALEASVRQMVRPTSALSSDMGLAIQDPRFFQSGDVILQLADREMKMHATLLCQRCPFFNGLFNGRAGGRWLAERRDSDMVRIDLGHIEWATFELVLRHIYSDSGDELFDDTVTEDLDGLLDVVMEVMSVANELILDRLSGVCQRFIGGFVTVRNVCPLLNAIAPSSVTDFKSAALEYLCHNLELMLATGLLEELDEDLMLELDDVVRANQLACLPFVRSGRSIAILHEKYPEMLSLMERERRIKIDSAMLRSKYLEGDGKASSLLRVSSEGGMAVPTSSSKSRRRPSKDVPERFESPTLTANRPGVDLMFEMDEDESSSAFDLDTVPTLQSPRDMRRDSRGPGGPQPSRSTQLDHKGKGPIIEGNSEVTPPSSPAHLVSREAAAGGLPGPVDLLNTNSTDILNSNSIQEAGDSSAREPRSDIKLTSSPWRSIPAQPLRLGMRDIIAQDSSSKQSSLSLQLSATAKKQEGSSGSPITKLSQKERKKLQQAQLSATKQPSPSLQPEERSGPTSKPSSPWQTVSSSPRASPQRAVSGSSTSAPPTSITSSARSSSASHLTLRQTVANNGPAAKQDMDQSHEKSTSQKRSVTSPQIPSTPPQPAQPSSANNPKPVPASPTPPKIQSIRHIVPARAAERAELGYQLSIADIVSEQEAEKNFIKDAVAKRSLQDIQMEQEFQEWWDQESKKVMEEEAAAAKAAESAAKGGKARRPRGRGGGGRGRGGGGGSSDRAGRGNKGRGHVES